MPFSPCFPKTPGPRFLFLACSPLLIPGPTPPCSHQHPCSLAAAGPKLCMKAASSNPGATVSEKIRKYRNDSFAYSLSVNNFSLSWGLACAFSSCWIPFPVFHISFPRPRFLSSLWKWHFFITWSKERPSNTNLFSNLLLLELRVHTLLYTRAVPLLKSRDISRTENGIRVPESLPSARLCGQAITMTVPLFSVHPLPDQRLPHLHPAHMTDLPTCIPLPQPMIVLIKGAMRIVLFC